MNKIFMVMFSLLVATNVKALETTYYSNYGSFGEFQEQEILSDHLTKVETEERFLYYKEVKEYSDYVIEGQNNLDYPLIQKDDFITSNFSSWQINEPINVLNRIIETKQTFEYRDVQKVRYVHFYNLSGSYTAFRIPELIIKSNNISLNYSIYCEKCSTDFLSNVHNNIVGENDSYIYNGGYLRVDLGAYYSLDSLTIDLYLYDVGTDLKKYSIAITKEPSLTNLIYSRIIESKSFTNVDFYHPSKFTYNVNNMTLVNPEFTDWAISDVKVYATKTRQIKEYTMYRYYDTLYKYYRINKVFNNTYTKDIVDDYILKSDQMKIYYRAQKRNMITIKEPIVIDNENIDLMSFVINTTSNPTITSNINYSKNGIYEVKFTMDDLVVEKDATVNIAKNIVIPKEEVGIGNVEESKPTTAVKEEPKGLPITNDKIEVKETQEPKVDVKPIEEASTKSDNTLQSESKVVDTDNTPNKNNDIRNLLVIILVITSIVVIITLKKRSN